MDVNEESIKLMAYLRKYYLHHTKTDLKWCCFILFKTLSMKMFIGFVKLHTDLFITLHHIFKIFKILRSFWPFIFVILFENKIKMTLLNTQLDSQTLTKRKNFLSFKVQINWIVVSKCFQRKNITLHDWKSMVECILH